MPVGGMVGRVGTVAPVGSAGRAGGVKPAGGVKVGCTPDGGPMGCAGGVAAWAAIDMAPSRMPTITGSDLCCFIDIPHF